MCGLGADSHEPVRVCLAAHRDQWNSYSATLSSRPPIITSTEMMPKIALLALMALGIDARGRVRCLLDARRAVATTRAKLSRRARVSVSRDARLMSRTSATRVPSRD